MSTRHESAAVTSAMAGETPRMHFFASIAMTNTTMYVWTGVGSLAVGSTTYLGVGHFGRIDAIQEETAVFPRALRLRLSGVNSAALYEPMTENLFGKPVKVYRGVFDSQWALVNTLEAVGGGRINRVDIRLRDGAEGDYIELEVEPRLRREPRAAYYTRQDIALTHSGDTFFNYLEQIPHFKSKWGQEPTGYFGGAGGSGAPAAPRSNRHPRFGGQRR